MQHIQHLSTYDNDGPPPLPNKTGAADPNPPPIPERPKNIPSYLKVTSPQTNGIGDENTYVHRKDHYYPKLPSNSPPKLPPKNIISIQLDEKTERDRSNVVNELIENEKLFYVQMTYLSEILSNGQIGVPIFAEDLAAIKINLPDFISSSGEILAAYNKAVSEAPGNKLSHASIATHLMPHLPRLSEVIINYIKEFDPQIVEHRPQLTNYFAKADELLQKKESTITTLLDRLFKLFQRPFHIMGILNRLKKFTPDNHPDYPCVLAAAAAIQTVCDKADACKRTDVDYSSSSTYQGSLELDADGNLEDSRMMYYRKKQKNLAFLLDNLCKWIENHSKDLKALIGDRRCLIKASHGLLVSLDNVQSISAVLDFHSTMVNHSIENFNSEKVSFVPNSIQNQPRYLKAKPNLTYAISKYRADESRAMTISEGILNRTETVIRNLFLFYLQKVHELMLFLAIKPGGIMHRYAKNKGWIDKSEVKGRIDQDVESWKAQIRLVQPSLPIALDRLCGAAIIDGVERGWKGNKKLLLKRPKNKQNNVSEAIGRAIVANANPDPAMFHHRPPNPVGRAKVLFSYSDKQTTVQLRPGDTVNVIKWGDDLGNSEWALIRVGNSSHFYYPSNRLQPI
ncbi:unnamed protein product [Rodentolepis nana]|uniref:DH domain-containing protein n=1 Tax=Rodentolepis nana TaxID=102285 RepID=A0A0R3TMN9_RODNA|nr:unnamed protein product [Rodentolepis nana]